MQHKTFMMVHYPWKIREQVNSRFEMLVYCRTQMEFESKIIKNNEKSTQQVKKNISNIVIVNDGQDKNKKYNIIWLIFFFFVFCIFYFVFFCIIQCNNNFMCC